MMEQFIEIKSANPDSLLFYRMGDFYELFFEDAEVASRALGITLTKRGKHLGQDIPMCGVPVHSADDYLQKLIGLGHRVAVCEQIEDPAEAKKRGAKSVVKRDVVRLVTPDAGEVVVGGTDMAALSQLKPAFREMGEAMPGFDAVALMKSPDLERIHHIHHAGNSSGIVDGAAAVLVESKIGCRRISPRPPCTRSTGPVTNPSPVRRVSSTLGSCAAFWR